MEEKKTFRAGFVAIIGRPNVGKSTLVNRLVGQKVSIVTSRPQTTRNRIQGIVNLPGAQIILIDTPGLHQTRSALGRQMAQEIAQALEGIDILCAMVDATERIGHEDREALSRAAGFHGPAILLLNKIDRMPKEKLLPLIEKCSKLHDWKEIIPISAITGDGADDLLAALVANLPANQPFFPVDQYTDQPERFLAAEIVREKAMAATNQEVPHAIASLVDVFEESPSLVRIAVSLFVEAEGQKGILIGKQGAMLKKIGTSARIELEKLLGTKVFLELHVKTQPGWRNNPAMVRQLDWRNQLENLSDIQAGTEFQPLDDDDIEETS
ncbi:MAG TPA: GTPase Era [Candidatus Acidoferrales bacterium]|nr:GTPase Era [Candidatus Acidoferrales bacterium]